MTARVVFQIVASGLPGGRPELAGFVVAQIDIAASEIVRHIVIAVTRDAPQPGITIEGVATSRVRDDPKVGLATKVVDPRQRRIRTGYNVFLILIIEITKLHMISPGSGLSLATEALAAASYRCANAPGPACSIEGGAIILERRANAGVFASSAISESLSLLAPENDIRCKALRIARHSSAEIAKPRMK